MNPRFGTFEVDLAAWRLLRDGMPIPLREQPFQVLAALLERPGELVTREELRRRLWPEHTFVDFEVGLNTAVSRLRQALSDDADSPQFIETVPKRGYRFIAQIARQHSVAVMPFTNESADADNEYFSDGLTDELIRALSRVEELKVATRSVVSRYKAAPYDLKQVGRDLGVEAVLEGSVRKSGDRIRVSVHLAGAEDGFELWADRFDTEMKDVFVIQDEVCNRVTEALKIHLKLKPAEARPRNVEAYVLYLRGHHLMKRHTPTNLQKGLQYFKEAIRLDPGYALPYHGAALFHILGALMGDLRPRDALQEAEYLLSRGLALDEKSAMVQNTLGMLRMFQWRWGEAEHAYQRAIALEAANAYPRMMYALLCTFRCRHDDALRHAGKALELDPLDPMTNFRFVQSSYYARRYEEAVRSGRIAIELSQDFPHTHWYLALSLAALGMTDEAWSMANRGRLLGGAQALNEGHFGYLAGLLGHTAEAQAVIRALKNRRRQGYCPAVPIAWTHLGLGDIDLCLDWLGTALVENEPYLASVRVFPGYDRVQIQPRFKELVHQIGLAD